MYEATVLDVDYEIRKRYEQLLKKKKGKVQIMRPMSPESESLEEEEELEDESSNITSS